MRPGTVIRLVDNRAPKLATPEAEWWSARGMGAGATEAGATALDETEVFGEEKNVRRETARARGWRPGLSATKKTSRAAPQKPQKPGVKQMVNRDGVDMRVPEEA